MRSATVIFATLLTAFLLFVFFGHTWWVMVVEGRAFGSLLILDFLKTLPFTFPFLLGGYLLSRADVPDAQRWIHVTTLGITGSGLLALIVQINLVTFSLTPYIFYLYPLLFSFAAFILLPLAQTKLQSRTKRSRATR